MKPINEYDLQQVSAYIDGELSDSERRFFQKRLSNDSALRACCERAWIVSSVLKSQPIQLMPNGSAEAICAQCEPATHALKRPLYWVASFGALALLVGLSLQFVPVNTSTLPDFVHSGSPILLPDAHGIKHLLTQANQNIAVSTKQIIRPNALRQSTILAAQDSPLQFKLNESTRAKSWPKSNQDMDDYVVRHNQMIGTNASNGLISYAQILTESVDNNVRKISQNADQDSQ
jgi:hypothetical protein